eukprot:13609051-Ditylum_brightwellii.AAC.1
MDLPVGLGSLVAVQHEPTGVWYHVLIITERWDSHGLFDHTIWLDVPCGMINTKAIVSGDCVKYYFFCPTSAAAA